MTTFSTILRREGDPIWTQILVHPFLVEMGEGRLPTDKFRYYITQDYPFLIEFARCLAIATAKAEDTGRMLEFRTLMNASLTTEVEMLVRLGERLAIPPDELKQSFPSPTTLAYTRHLLYIAFSSSIGELMAAMLPCMWSYQEIGDKLTKERGIQNQPLYAEWSATYITQEYTRLVDWYRRLVDDAATKTGPYKREKMKAHFLVSSNYEYMFWDMAYHQAGWPFPFTRETEIKASSSPSTT